MEALQELDASRHCPCGLRPLHHRRPRSRVGPGGDEESAGRDRAQSRLAPFTLDSSATTIPVGFIGHDAVRIANALERLESKKKGEFESTADFEARKVAERLAAPATRYLGELTLGDMHAFSVPVRKLERYFWGGAYSNCCLLPHIGVTWSDAKR